MSEMGDGDSDGEFFSKRTTYNRRHPFSPTREKVKYNYNFDPSSDEEEDDRKKSKPRKRKTTPPETVAEPPPFVKRVLYNQIESNPVPAPQPKPEPAPIIPNPQQAPIIPFQHGPVMQQPGPMMMPHPQQGPMMPMPQQRPMMGHPPQGPMMGHPPQGPMMGHPPQGPMMGHPQQGPMMGMPPQGPMMGMPPQGPMMGHPQMGMPPQGPMMGHPPMGMPPQGPMMGHHQQGPMMGHPPQMSMPPPQNPMMMPNMMNMNMNMNMGMELQNQMAMGMQNQMGMGNLGMPMGNQMCMPPMGGMPQNQFFPNQMMRPPAMQVNQMQPPPVNNNQRPNFRPSPRYQKPFTPVLSEEPSHSAVISKPPVLVKSEQPQPIVHSQPEAVKNEIESDSDESTDTAEASKFKNDGSFLELFKKMNEKDATDVKKENEDTKSVPKCIPNVGKRRGGRVLKTGLVQKIKKTDTADSGTPQDPWSIYMAEVKKYRETNCEEEGKTRALVK